MATQQRKMEMVTLETPIMVELASEQAKAMIGAYLKNSKFSAQELLVDLAATLTVNPKLKACTPESLLDCLLFAARHELTFGKYGVHIVPRKIGKSDTLQAMPVLAAKAREAKTKEKLGVARIICEVVREGESFKVLSDRGVVIGVEHEIDYTKARDDPKGLLLGYGIGVWPDDEKRFYHIVTLADINRAKDASAAQTSGPWTNKNYIKMVHKTIMNRTTEAMVGDFTVGLGGGGGSLQIDDDATIDAEFGEVPEGDIPFGKPGTSSDMVADAILQDGKKAFAKESQRMAGAITSNAKEKQVEAEKDNAGQAPNGKSTQHETTQSPDEPKIVPLSDDAQKMVAGPGPARNPTARSTPALLAGLAWREADSFAYSRTSRNKGQRLGIQGFRQVA